MQLPNPERAVAGIEKLRDYCLNPEHPRGKHKARVFAATLELHAVDAEVLQRALLLAIRTQEAIPAGQDEYGERYSMDFAMTHRGRTATVRSNWIVRAGEDFPRLTSCYVR